MRFVSLEALYEPVDDYLVEVVAAEVCITVCREHLEHAATELEDRDIECTATEVEHCDLHVLVSLVYAVSECGCCRLVHDTADVETCNLTCLLCSLAL